MMAPSSRWLTGPLGRFIPLQRGFDLPVGDVVPGAIPVVYSNGIGRHHNVAMVDGPGVVTGRSGTIGKVHFVEGPYWPHNTALWVTDFRYCDPRFAYHFLKAFGLERFSSGSGVPTLNRNDAHSFVVSVPQSRGEQRLIATALDDADTLISSLERMLRKKQAIKQGMAQRLLTGEARLPGFDGSWERAALKEVARLSRGSGLPKSAIDAFGSKPCIHYGELFTFYGPEIRSVTGRTNAVERVVTSEALDVLMPTSDVTPRGLAKASAVHERGIILGGDILIIRGNRRRIYGPFLAHVIRYDANQVLQLVRGTTVYHVYAGDMRNFEVTLPPAEEQKAIAAALWDAGREVEALERRVRKTQAVARGMAQRLLTGKARLPEAEPVA